MKIRSLYAPMERAVLEEFGAEAKPMPYNHIIPAFQWKKIDGVRSSLVVMAASKFYVVIKNITVVNDRAIPSVAWVSKVWFNKLPADLQKIVVAVSRDLEDWGAWNAIARFKVERQAWKDNGAEVIYF
ncbi:MAG TPA: hypothetical protein EYN66_02070, partial [Myxococcales bacterium]|nr:hypothetical protein [Myxococcales bacterium]